jgi:ribokinase
MSSKSMTIMGIFVADLAFRVTSVPAWGETIFGSDFLIGPGGKGSNQAVAAARLGSKVSFIGKVGKDVFGDLGRRTLGEAGVSTKYLYETPERATGAAAIIVEQASRENAIVVVPGAAAALTLEEVSLAGRLIEDSAVFMTQLELPLNVVEHGLRIARGHNVPTILNPAPARDCTDGFLELCDYLTPNQIEAEMLTGRSVTYLEQAEQAAEILLRRGVKNVVITLGAGGAFIKNRSLALHIPAYFAGPVVETTGAGDAFNGGLAVGLIEGRNLPEATRLGCAVAAISVTRAGTAPSMPARQEVEALMKRESQVMEGVVAGTTPKSSTSTTKARSKRR